eukprot:CAMPEP_0174830162 /NCGR_PEP_ID=MMETSP1114-20130205/2371_1 /TAXON_ID=312471 /ORGANISM="Neobodo designis, Strain CCAP 1951/1" /LENGTH=354 /DNA_ID=CAMNT_0016063949 /DNA_START=36 /DNA_END=1100 /DNA_ORIENTATION=-
MPAMRRLHATEVALMRRFARLDPARYSTHALARDFRVSSATVSYWLNCTHLPGQLKRKAPKNCLKAMRARRRHVGKLARATVKINNRTIPAYPSTTCIQRQLRRAHKIEVSRVTIRTDLIALGFVCRVRPRVPCTDQADFARRYTFVRHVIARRLTASRIIFSDEKLFTTNDFSGRSMWVSKDGHALPRENARWPVKLMVWGAIGHGFRMLKILRNRTNDREGFKLTTESYCRIVLQGDVVNALRASGKTFMQDGAACHTAGRTLRYLASKGVQVLEGWPARSPDLNPIERLWAILQVRVSRHSPRTIDELEAAVLEEWAAVSTATIDGVVDDFDTRVATVNALRGGWPTNRDR